ncbi:ribosome small subunit-dependent GTPase A [Fusobacterium sp.]|uniref:ribosome small subunit-dependent GTPase A n=1 Tax=Fusobacterium sp. TaxID=68766 RepID=UPI002633975B|nr:ribosome small subunit-dependent GTPase A [Fusobacterium sp.]
MNKIQGFYYVKSGNEVYECKLRGILKRKDKKDNCVVGDIVEISEDNSIVEVYPRKNMINRPLVSNIDYLVIQFAGKDPDVDLDRLNTLILNSIYYKIDPIVIINKIDLLTEEEISSLKEKLSYLEKIDIPLFFVSTYKDIGVQDVINFITGKTVAFGGPSGVGKSSILNLLQNEEKLVVGETSKRLRAGKHTTRDSKFIPSICGGYVIDTPGFSSIELPPIKDFAELISLFKEFYINEGEHCKFLNCHHISEPGCLIKDLVEKEKISKIRYDFYKKVYEKLKIERWNNYEKY